MKTSLEHKTIRPGSLSDYSFYYSSRQQPVAASKPKASGGSRKRSILAVLAVVVAVGLYVQLGHNDSKTVVSSQQAAQAKVVEPAKTDKASTPKTAPAIADTKSTACADNTLDKYIKVSVMQRHLWACEGTKVAYDTPVITGMEKHASTLTPRGTYKIYGKVADTVLTGSDETGTWKDPVSYWMPFLDNQYGTYGFHDATWRQESEFGHIDAVTSDDASHGCVELPLGASGWLYSWSPVGTTVAVES